MRPIVPVEGLTPQTYKEIADESPEFKTWQYNVNLGVPVDTYELVHATPLDFSPTTDILIVRIELAALQIDSLATPPFSQKVDCRFVIRNESDDQLLNYWQPQGLPPEPPALYNYDKNEFNFWFSKSETNKNFYKSPIYIPKLSDLTVPYALSAYAYGEFLTDQEVRWFVSISYKTV